MLSNTEIILLGMLFFVVGSPAMYNLVNKYISVKEDGCPSNRGVMLHAVVFMILVVLIWEKRVPSALSRGLKNISLR